MSRFDPVKKRLFELLGRLRAWWWTGPVSASNNAVSAPTVRLVEQRARSTPVNGWRAENVTTMERREPERWVEFPPGPEPITDRTCQVGGGNLVLVVLNYHWDHGTDVVIPADRAEKCLSGGRVRGGREGS